LVVVVVTFLGHKTKFDPKIDLLNIVQQIEAGLVQSSASFLGGDLKKEPEMSVDISVALTSVFRFNLN